MKKMLVLALTLMMLLSILPPVQAEEAPPAMSEGATEQGVLPQPPEGGPGQDALPQPTEGGPGQDAPPQPPEGGMGGAAPSEYAAVYTATEDMRLTGELTSAEADENLLHVQAGTATVTNAQITRSSQSSTGGDAASFYGVGAAVLATGGTAVVSQSAISTDAEGGTGVFAYGDGVVSVSDTVITTRQNTSGGIHVAGGGTLYAANLDVTTYGESSAAIRSDRGRGTMAVDGGVYTSHGLGSPAVYVTADIAIRDAQLEATDSEALCLEGRNAVRLYDCSLKGSMRDLSQNDTTWTVILYQSMSGDSEVGKGRFEMDGGALESANGGVFYTTNTQSEFILRDVDITASRDSEFFLRVTGNANQRGWGRAGANGAQCVFTGLSQRMDGDVRWDSISTLDLYLLEGSRLTGSVVQDEACAGTGGDGYCSLFIDAESEWIVTGDSTLTHLYCAGDIRDAEGNAVRVVTADGTVLLDGTSGYTVTVDAYDPLCDTTGSGTLSATAPAARSDG